MALMVVPLLRKKGAAAIIDSPMRTLALEQDCSARRIRHVGDLPTGFEGILEMDLLMNLS